MQIKKDGIKQTYLRFLSDSAAGYLLWGILLFFMQRDGGLPRLTEDVGIRWFLAGLALLLGPPVGLLLNSVSWFLLGFLEQALGRLFLCAPFPTPTKTSFDYPLLIERYKVDRCKSVPKQLRQMGDRAQQVLQALHPATYSITAHGHGLKRFCRSLALISLVLALVTAASGELAQSAACVLAFVLLILLVGALEGYQGLLALSLLLALGSKGRKARRFVRGK